MKGGIKVESDSLKKRESDDILFKINVREFKASNKFVGRHLIACQLRRQVNILNHLEHYIQSPYISKKLVQNEHPHSV